MRITPKEIIGNMAQNAHVSLLSNMLVNTLGNDAVIWCHIAVNHRNTRWYTQ